MSIDSILQKFERFGIKLGLEPSYQLLANLGNPQQQVPIVHVAGSNGKGSVCAYLSAVLTEAGYRVGRYTSPHLIDWTERICLNDRPISAQELEQTLHQVIAAIQPDEPTPTQFEVITTAAWLYFAQQQVDVAVMEVGLGGRLDATNVVDCPLVSIIASLSREHWQRLGPTLADIAGEKAGILKPACPAVLGAFPPEAKAVVDRRAVELGCPTLYPEPARDLGNGYAEYDAAPISIRYRLPLQGAIQLQNSALAIAALHLLQQQGWTISEAAIVNGIAKTQWTGRLQWFAWNDHKILIDGAHNPASAEVLRQYVDTLGRSHIHWVMGMLSTKDHADVFKALLRGGDRLSIVPVPDHSSAMPEQLAALAHEVCPDLASCQVFGDVVQALGTALYEAEQANSHPLVVLCGSLYLIGHFLKQATA